ncbi:AMP-binding protein [Streptomyces coeruleorubidus]|uniref:AMP-binding protein n=1 Tax=Streptomyces coeruleorubidus TaxID=116188 RepID=UPI00237FC04A|nr:AMP-binding protein [Streptomyces coeruleorubidus]WDV49079.1 AMP-binding protein [Streptomyces coeruleorubidus]
MISGTSRLTYRELEEHAGQLAAVLREQHTTTDGDADVVALWLPRSTDLVVAMLATLKAGRAYVPLDPSLGRARAEQVIAECGARTLVSTHEAATALNLPGHVTVVPPDATGRTARTPPCPPPTPGPRAASCTPRAAPAPPRVSC